MPLWKHPPTKPRPPCHPTKPHAMRACERDARSSQPPELAVQHAHSQERGGLPQIQECAPAWCGWWGPGCVSQGW